MPTIKKSDNKSHSKTGVILQLGGGSRVDILPLFTANVQKLAELPFREYLRYLSRTLAGLGLLRGGGCRRPGTLSLELPCQLEHVVGKPTVLDFVLVCG
jgi:hypothetical protein